MRLIALTLSGLMAAAPVAAQDRETLGVGRLFTNDYFGDGDDRWRSGSYAVSIVRGAEEWDAKAPTQFGSLLEYRLRSEIIAPSALYGAGSGDRAYVGALSAGVHTHFSRGGWDLSTGVDLVFVGQQTGLAALQDAFHDFVDAPRQSDAVQANQVDDAVYPTLVGEASYPVAVSEKVRFVPFAEAQIGVEDIVRVGGDFMIGSVLHDDLWLRDSTTGQLYAGVESERAGFGFVVGADYTYVSDSEYFPSSFGTIAADERVRARAGIHARLGDRASYFYGLTYLGEEFEGQSQGQFVGSLKLDFNF